LGNKLAFKGFLQNALPQGFGLFEALLNALLDFVADGKTGFDFGDDGVLFGNRTIRKVKGGMGFR
jgi:hypothetical protein